MNLLTLLQDEYGIRKAGDLFSKVLKIPCADDQKSFFYLTLPFRGVYCWANDVYCREIPTDYDDTFKGMSLNFCTEGSCEVSLFNGNFIYIKEGLLSIDNSAVKNSHFYPTSRYKGLEIVFDFEPGGEALPALSDFGFTPVEFLGNLESRSDYGSFMTVPDTQWRKHARVLSEHLIAQDMGIGEIRFRLLELLFTLSKKQDELVKANVGCLTSGQRKIASEVERLISGNLQEHFTIDGLAERYGISSSSLKKYFMQLYTLPFSAYLRKIRMERAAELIKKGEFSMGEIAEKVGYQNQGKFGAAFKEFFGETPSEYKRLSRCRQK